MAVSVRLPVDTGPYIEHYLVQSSDGLLALESSRFKFDSIPALIAHYAQCCDELPVQLTLPRALREAKNRQQLSSLALLGQEFWRYPMASAASPKDGQKQQQQYNNNNSSHSGSKSSSRDGNLQPIPAIRTQVNNASNTQVETPSDTTSSLSSFTMSNLQQHNRSQATTHPMDLLMSPESIDSVILTMSPMDNNRSPPGIIGKTSTFKVPSVAKRSAQNSPPLQQAPVITESYYTNCNAAHNLVMSPTSANNSLVMVDNRNITAVAAGLNPLSSGGPSNNLLRAPRPTPPNTLNLLPIRTPPAPPPRWSKTPTPTTISPISQQNSIESSSQNNFTVTTTVTFSVEGSGSQTPINGNGSGPQSIELATTPANLATTPTSVSYLIKV